MSRTTEEPDAPGAVRAEVALRDGTPPGEVTVGVTVAQDGRSTRWDDHRATRRAELVRLARRAVHRYGPDVSMDDIATTAETSKSVIYRYFTDKNGLRLAIGEAVVAQMHSALTKAASAATTPRDELRSMIEVYLEMVEASPNVYWFVTRPVEENAAASLGHFLERVGGLIARPLARVMTEAGRREAALADVWAAGAVGFVRGAGEWWLRHGGQIGSPSRAELTEHVTAWLWTGPVPRPGHHRGDGSSVPSYEIPVPVARTGRFSEPAAEAPAVVRPPSVQNPDEERP